MPYIPNTDDDRRRMLDKIGVKQFEELLAPLPEELRLKRPLNIPSLSEMELLTDIEAMSLENKAGLTSFAGGGVYDHFIPSAVAPILNRPEFMTAYTPYQAEVAQGTLQIIYEFQTHICRLTGMDVANASMYDGASASAEALMLTIRASKKRNKIIVSESVSPLYREVIQTYMSGLDVIQVVVPMTKGITDLQAMEDAIDENTAGVLIAQPNFFGLLEQIEPLSRMTQQVGAKLVMAVDPIAQAILKTPGEYGADVVIGEAQPLGIPVSFGGPLLGFLAVKQELVRSVPGRIAGRTKDVDGRDAYTLVLQTREQHIRRDKATSNICTNQALCATAATIYLSLLGKQGIRQVALLSAERAQATAKRICEIDGFEMYFDGPFVREFAVKTARPAQDVVVAMVEKNILPGISAGRWYDGMDDCLIVALTEKRSAQQIDQFVEGLRELSVNNVLSRM